MSREMEAIGNLIMNCYDTGLQPCALSDRSFSGFPLGHGRLQFRGNAAGRQDFCRTQLVHPTYIL